MTIRKVIVRSSLLSDMYDIIKCLFTMQTLSHAPTWSRDVARLMNAQHEYDWRFLATRLGYSKDDIRSWATQPDPCLSLLDEWFATHKTREATFAIEKALNEMNRTDAAMIVENALKMTGNVSLTANKTIYPMLLNTKHTIPKYIKFLPWIL